MPPAQTRRRFVTGLTAACTASLLCARRSFAADPPPETTSVRLPKVPIICFAPQYVGEELLRDEGFTDIRYVDIGVQEQIDESALGGGRVDFASNLTLCHIIDFDAGAPITVLSGVHVGCYERFVHAGIRTVAEQNGKSIGSLGADPLVSMITAWVGLDPKKDITLVGDPAAKPLELFVQGKLDAYLGFPPEPQALHARKAGHVILTTAVDRPWSQYFCCTLAGNREYVARRVIRALLKAADFCASTPSNNDEFGIGWQGRKTIPTVQAGRLQRVLGATAASDHDAPRSGPPHPSLSPRFGGRGLRRLGEAPGPAQAGPRTNSAEP